MIKFLEIKINTQYYMCNSVKKIIATYFIIFVGQNLWKPLKNPQINCVPKGFIIDSLLYASMTRLFIEKLKKFLLKK